MIEFRPMFRVMLLITLPLAALSCCAAEQIPKAAAEQNRSADEAAIRAQIAANQAATNKRDFAGVAATYAPDGDLMRLAGPRVSGRDAIRRAVEAALSRTPPGASSRTVDSIHFVSSDVAIIEITQRFSAGDRTQERGTFVMARGDGTWLIAAARVLPAEQQ